MALVKCPDCEKMISPRVQVCPFCGCPAEFFEVEKPSRKLEKKSESHVIDSKKNAGKPLDKKDDIVFWFGGQKFTYSLADQEIIRCIGYYLVMGEYLKYIVELAYDEYKSIADVLANMPDKVDEVIQEYILDVTSAYLYRMGNSISVQQFLRKYMDKYNMQYEPYYSPIVEKYANIRHEEAELAKYRNAVKNSRGRWVGGGFGVKGAVKGAVTAGMLNCGADFIHSFGDSSRERKDSLEIQRKLKALYNNPETKGRLSGGVRSYVLNIMQAMQDELLEIGTISSKYIIDREKAVVLYNNTLQWESDETKKYDNIAQCISLYPVGINFYKALEPAIMSHEENDISRFIEFWGFNSYFDMMFGTDEKKEGWELADTLRRYYKRYKVYQTAELVRREKKAALKYRDDNKQIEDIKFGDNFRRRFGPLIIYISDLSCLLTVPLYALQPEARPEMLKTVEYANQFLFWNNSELVVTDNVIVLDGEIIELKQINEVWYDANKNGIYLQVELKNKKGNVRKQCKQQTTIEVVTLLDIALEPYREIDYISKFSGEIKDLYRKLQNDGIINRIDSDEDKKRKKEIEKWYKKHKKTEIERYILQNRTKEEIDFSASIRRRFQKLLSIKGLEQNNFINMYIYELDAKNKELPFMSREVFDCKPDEFLIYADCNFEITDYALHINTNDSLKRQFYRFGMEEINEIYYFDADTIIVALKADSKFRKKNDETDKRIFITLDKKSREEMIYFVNIILEPYREPDYIPKAQNHYFCPSFITFVKYYEKEIGSFSDFISHEMNNETDNNYLELIKCKAYERIKERKKIATVYRKKHKNPIQDTFSESFAYLFKRLYEIDNNDIKYFDVFRNHYEYEIYDYVIGDRRRRIDKISDYGYQILWFGDFILTERHIYINDQAISLYEVNEFLIGKTVEANEAGPNDSWVNRTDRLLVKFINGKVQNINLGSISIPVNLMYTINYTLKILHNDNLKYYFLQETVPFCEKCGSLKVTVTDGFWGKKYCCESCNNKSKSKIIIYKNSIKEELYQEIAEKYDASVGQNINTAETVQENDGLIVCPKCGKKLSSMTKFCNFCGQSINQVNEETVFCVHCGKKILRATKFCNFCGQQNNMRKEVNANDM